MFKIKISIKLKWIKLSAIICVFLVLFLLIGYTVKQIEWNLFRQKFALNGYAVRVNKQFVVGVDKIIRGDEASKILLSLEPKTRIPDPGYEFLLLKIKVKNISQKAAFPLDYNLKLFSKGINTIGDRVDSIYFDFLPYGDYKSLNTTLPFLPGETWDCTTGYQIEKGRTLQRVNINSRKNLQTNPHFSWILLENPILSNEDLFIISFWLAFILSIWALWETYRQRKKRSDGLSGYLAPIFVILFIPFITLLIIDPASVFSDQFLIGYFFVLILVPFIFYFVAKKSYLAQFNWLSRENMKKLIDDFIVRMQWEEPNRKEKKDKITIQNPCSKDLYIFENNTIRVKNPSLDTKKAKEVLINLYSDSPFDWFSFYKTILMIFLAFLIYFVLITIFSGYYL